MDTHGLTVPGLNLVTLTETLATLRREFQQTAAQHDRDASFPHENFAALHRHGLLSLTVPAEFGGAEARLTTAARVIGEVARGEPATALVLTMQYLFQYLVARNPNWPEPLRDRVLRDAVINGGLGNVLRVEPELGTPARGGTLATVATRTTRGWRLSGHKLYSTGIPILSWLGVWGRTDEAEPRVGTFLVPRKTPGIRVVESWDHLGMRASGSHEVIFEDVEIPADHAVDLRSPGAWAKGYDDEQIGWMIALLSALYDGIAREAQNWLVRFSIDRCPSNLGASLSTLPRYQEAIGRIDALLLANRVLLKDLTASVDRGDPPPATQATLVKYLVTTNAISAVEQALELVGNPGLARANPLERHYRDVLCSRIHTPQNDAILTGAGNATIANFSQE